jgi:saccharopine dehydrogenase-like NADP-dependent oxidoreductase
MSSSKILIVGGYGEVGLRLSAHLEAAGAHRVIVGGRHPELVRDREARRIDVDDPSSVDEALEGISVVVACVRQRQPHLLRAAIRRGIGYTSIAPPWIPWAETAPLRAEAERTGARIILAAGLEPGVSSVLVRCTADDLGGVDAVETALCLSVGDSYGPDSMGFIFDEITEPYSIVVDGDARLALAFESSRLVTFPAPFGTRRAYTMPFRDQLYYPATLGAKTAVARIALDPPWLATGISAALRVGLRRALARGTARGRMRGLVEALRRRYAELDGYALVVDVHRGERTIRYTLVGRQQAKATAVGVAAITEALWAREVDAPGVWLPEQVIAPAPFLARLAAHGIVPVREAVRAHGATAPERLASAPT